MKPIIFNTEMVRAILRGDKTQTRRPIKIDLGTADTDRHDKNYLKIPDEYGDYWDAKDLCQYQPGNILWVRETWSIIDDLPYDNYVYRTDFGTTEDDSFPPSMFKWRPSIHMPKEAARLFLRVTGVRAERLQEITYFGCIAEGMPYKQFEKDIIKDFQYLWDGIYNTPGKMEYRWDVNPWVWVIEFERVDAP